MFSGFIFLSSWLIGRDGYRRDNNIIMEIKEKELGVGIWKNTRKKWVKFAPLNYK